MKGFVTKALLGGILVFAVLPASAGAANRVAGDFNNDGFDDLAIGVDDESVGPGIGVPEAGAVHVLYGSTGAGLTAVDDDFIDQDSVGLLEAVEQNDRFGAALAAGDFNQDGYDDLAVGVRLEDRAAVFNNDGVVHVIYGGAAGLSSAGNTIWDQDTGTIQSTAGPDETFGDTLAAGDFSGDGIDDLAVGTPEEDVGAAADAGAIHILLGSVGTGITDGGSQLWDQDTGTIDDTAEQSDWFGSALAAGDLNGDGVADLVVGAHGEEVGGDAEAGGVNVIYGDAASGGLADVGNQFWSQDSNGIGGAAEQDDLFGFSLAVGDMNGDQVDDLAVGAPEESLAGGNFAGGVNALYGSLGAGITNAGDQHWQQDTAGILDTVEPLDTFGTSLTIGDVDGDGDGDLAVGVSNEERVVGSPDHGIIALIPGSPGVGLTDVGDERWDQDRNGVTETAESSDQLGESLSGGDFDGDGFDDIAAGAPHEALVIPGLAAAGAGGVNVIYGGAGGLSGAGDQFWSQDTPGVRGRIEPSDQMGDSLLGTPQ